VVIFAAGTGNPFFSTDTAAALRAMEIQAQALFKATKVEGIYDSRSRAQPAARRCFARLTYDRFLADRIGVMDSTAVTLCRDNKLPIRVFKLVTRGQHPPRLQGRADRHRPQLHHLREGCPLLAAATTPPPPRRLPTSGRSRGARATPRDAPRPQLHHLREGCPLLAAPATARGHNSTTSAKAAHFWPLAGRSRAGARPQLHHLREGRSLLAATRPATHANSPRHAPARGHNSTTSAKAAHFWPPPRRPRPQLHHLREGCPLLAAATTPPPPRRLPTSGRSRGARAPPRDAPRPQLRHLREGRHLLAATRPATRHLAPPRAGARPQLRHLREGCPLLAARPPRACVWAQLDASVADIAA
jgi:hypothetical protein